MDSYDMQYKKCVLAYIDVLGIRNAFRNPSECDLLPWIFSLLQSVNQYMVNRDKECVGFKFKYFSDNVCIYKEVHENDELESLAILVDIVRGFVVGMTLTHGYLSRGGITVGELYSDENFIIGKALIEAYNLESKCAITPRVIIDKQYGERLYKHFLKKEHNLLIRDSDNLFFVNYLEGRQIKREGYLKRHKDVLEGLFLRKELEIEARSKVLMSINFHNRCASMWGLEQFKINITDLIERASI